MSNQRENEYLIKLDKNINNIKRILFKYFENNPDFTKDNMNIIVEIESNVKRYCKTILLINQYVSQIINETYDMYKLKNQSDRDVVNEYLYILYESIINDVYNYLYPQSIF